MKILALGNSFSEDATAYLEGIAPTLYVRNLHIAGCSLEMHAAHLAAGDPAYVFEENAKAIDAARVAANEVMKREPWDVITVQQASHFSGLPETYEPHLTRVIEAIRTIRPGARIVFHETWAYAKDSTHAQFCRYRNDQAEMARAIRRTAGWAAAAHGLDRIPTGRFIAYLRANGPAVGDEYTRDGFHMNLPYGRYAAALVWAHFFGAPVTDFCPEGADPDVLHEIRALYDRFAVAEENDGAEP